MRLIVLRIQQRTGAIDQAKSCTLGRARALMFLHEPGRDILPE
jgi:hypothetical protein